MSDVALAPYADYRESGLLWLGRIPAHWEVRTLRQCGAIKGGSTPSKGNDSFWTDGTVPWVTPKDMKSFNIAGSIDKLTETAIDLTTLSLMEPPVVLLVVRGMILARTVPIGVTTVPVTVNQDMKAIVPSQETDARFLAYAMSASRDAFASVIGEAGHGTKRLPTYAWTNIGIAMPHLEEQRTIARYLDHHGHLVKQFIRRKQRLIELLTEQKQAIVHRAVTRGLDPGVRMKDSGVGWLGEVPEHWEIGSLRRYSTNWCDGPFGSGLTSAHYSDDGVRVIRLQNIGMGAFRSGDAAYIPEDHYAALGNHDVLGGDVIIAGLGDERIPAGRACVAPVGIEPAMVKADCFRFRLNASKLLPAFAALQLSTTAANASGVLSTGATRQRVNLRAMSGRVVAVPPLDEQQAAVACLPDATRSSDDAIEQTQQEIDLIIEYRTRLIVDAVTGQVDVRGMRVPDFDDSEMLWGEEEMVEVEEGKGES